MQDLPKIVRSRLQEAAAAEAHPDADLLTAFAERTLAESERVLMVEHLAGCGDCREVLAFALPTAEAIEADTSTRPVRSGWLSLPVLRWGIVAAGIIAVTSLSIVQYRHRQSKSETVVSNLIARNDTSSAPHALRSSPQVSEPQVVLPQAEIRQPRLRNKVLPNGAEMTAEIPERIPAQRLDRQVAIPPSSQVVEVQAEAAAVTAQKQVPEQFALSQKEPPFQNRSLTDSGVVKAKDPAFSQAASNGARWTISSAGDLQRSFDEGKTWEEVNVNAEPTGDSVQVGPVVRDEQKKLPNKTAQPGLVLRAVAAIGSEVWAGGSGATLYHSGDSGAHWTRVLPSSAAVAVTGDITGIEFSDPQHGRITTSAGEFWITGDGGQTWGPQR
jgi:hypothetical protein